MLALARHEVETECPIWDEEPEQPPDDIFSVFRDDEFSNIPSTKAKPNGRTITRRIDCPDGDERAPTASLEQFKTYTSRELAAAEFKTEYLIDNLLVDGQHLILAGARKTLKTNIIVDLGISLSCGGWFLQQFKVNRPIRVGIMSGESGDSTIQETANRVCRAKGVELADLTSLVWTFELPQLGTLAEEIRLQDWITNHELEFCVIDPAYLAMPLGDDAGNLFKVGEKLKTITNVAKATGCTMAICHHARKRRKGDQSYDALELDDIAWSGFQEWARQWLLLGRREAYDPANGGSHKLWMSSGGSAGHSGLWGVDIDEGIWSDHGGRRWDVRALKAAEVIQARDSSKDVEGRRKSERQTAADVEKVRQAVVRIPSQGESKSEIAALAGLSNARCTPALVSLSDEGVVERCDVPKNGRLYSGWRRVGQPGLSRTESDNPTE